MGSAANWIERFGQHLTSERRLSPLTVSAYRRELDAFAQWCAQQGIGDFARIDAQHVRSFAARSHAGGLQARSVQRRLSALRTFFGFLMREGAVPANPAVGISAPKAGKRLRHVLVDRAQRGALGIELRVVAVRLCQRGFERFGTGRMRESQHGRNSCRADRPPHAGPNHLTPSTRCRSRAACGRRLLSGAGIIGVRSGS